MGQVAMDFCTLQIFTPIISAASEQSNWLQILSGLLTPVVAALGIWIAFNQWRTARMKLKLDLFDKRIVVYEVVRDALSRVSVDCRVSQETLGSFLLGVAGARWLFNDAVDRYLRKDLWILLSRVQAVQAEQLGAHGEALADAITKLQKVLDEVRLHRNEIDSKFAPFLSLRH